MLILDSCRPQRCVEALLRHDFSSFIGRAFATVDPGAQFMPNWHIHLIAEYLQAAEHGEIPRLIINMPPRSLKSICVSVAWPAWLLGHDPASRILAASYASSLSLKHSLDCRAVMQSPWYRRVFPGVTLASDQNEKRKFMTTRRGYRYAGSVGGAITGEGGKVLILDDPINPSQSANSRWREFVNQWFDHTFISRLDDKQKGTVVLVMQRLHPNDLTHYLLQKGGWQHVCLPAIAVEKTIHDFGACRHTQEKGAVMHAARENIALLERAKIELGSSAFAAQYQQDPLPEEGNLVQPWWFRRYATLPDGLRHVQSWDTAIKSGPVHDASACLTFGENGADIYLVDARVLRVEYPDLRRACLRMAAQWRPEAILIEDKASGQQVIQDLKRETSLPIIAVQPQGNKVVRFAAISAMIEAGRVLLPENAAWLADFEAEIYHFPSSAHDDQVDALTQYLDWVRGRYWNTLGIRPL